MLGASVFYGISSMSAATKDAMRDLILGGGPWTQDEQEAILSYCQQDVEVLTELLTKMAPDIDLDYAFYRGKYLA